jgi:predicted aspartyl protease
MDTQRYFSRRQFLKAGTSLLTVASVARAGGQNLVDGETVPTLITTEKDSENRLTVPVHIHGKGPYRFIVDTGADRTVLASEVGVELGLLRGARVVLHGVVQAMLTDTVAIRELTYGSITSRNLSVPTLPHGLLGADGYLGLDCLDCHRVTFDFKRGLLQVNDPRPKFSASWVRANETRVRTFGTSGHLRSLDCRVDGIPAAAFIDSGADVSAANAPLLTALARRNPGFGEIGNIQLIDITGGEILGKVVVVKKIQLPGLGFDDCPLVIANFQVFKAWGLLHSPAVLIGMNLLRQFSKVSIDYGLKELSFDLATFGPRQSYQAAVV